MPRPMRVLQAVAAIAGLLVAGFSFRQDGPFTPVTVTGRYHAADFGSIEVTGVCNADPNGIRCWNAKGILDPALTENIQDYYVPWRKNNLYFEFGRKNRLIVLRRPEMLLGRLSNGYVGFSGMLKLGGHDLGSMGREGGSYGGAQGGNYSGQFAYDFVTDESEQKPFHEWFLAVADLNQKTIDIDFDLKVELPKVRIPLAVGAEGQIGPVQVRIDAIKSIHAQHDQRLGKRGLQASWSVSISIVGYTGRDIPSLSGNPVDEKGKTIRRVLFSGKPIPENSDLGTRLEGSDPTPVSNAEMRLVAGAGTEHQVLSLIANPKQVSALELTAIGIRKVKITDIPLDPKE